MAGRADREKAGRNPAAHGRPVGSAPPPRFPKNKIRGKAAQEPRNRHSRSVPHPFAGCLANGWETTNAKSRLLSSATEIAPSSRTTKIACHPEQQTSPVIPNNKHRLSSQTTNIACHPKQQTSPVIPNNKHRLSSQTTNIACHPKQQTSPVIPNNKHRLSF